ncbi:MAG: tyrosine-type recombinase/integrase [Eubacterium sp.]
MPSKHRTVLTIGHNPITGKAITKNFCGNTKKEVQSKIDKYKLEASTGIRQDGNIVNFSTWAWEWLATYKEHSISDSGYNSYSLCINHLNEYFGNQPLNLIRPIDMQKFFKSKQHLSQSMVSKLRITANSIFETAIENDLCFKNPLRNLPTPKGIAPKTKHIYTANQATTVVNFAKTHEYGLGVFILLKTGLRRGELMGLIPSEDFDLDAKRLYVRRSITDVQGKVSVNIGGKSKNAVRTIPLDEETVDFLKHDIRTHQSGYLFKNRNGRYMSPKSWAVNRYTKFTEDLLRDHPDLPKLTPHELRHTYGTLLYKSGLSIRNIQKIMGHADISTTMQIYVHDDIEDIEKDFSQLSIGCDYGCEC